MTIQAYWRGYRAREHNPYVVSVRKEIRARRAEDHIMLLRQELERLALAYKKTSYSYLLYYLFSLRTEREMFGQIVVFCSFI